MSEMNFEKFSQFAYHGSVDYRDRQRYLKFVDMINRYIEKDHIAAFYPKNLFLDENDLTIYIFQEHHFSILQETNNGSMSLVTYKYRDITKLELIYSDERQYSSLKVMIGENDFIFNPHEDTNRAWAYAFGKLIDDMYKLLCKK